MIIKTLLSESKKYFRSWYEFVVEHVDGRKLAIHVHAHESNYVVKFYKPNESGFDWNFFYMEDPAWITNICNEWDINPEESDWFVSSDTLTNTEEIQTDAKKIYQAAYNLRTQYFADQVLRQGNK